MKMNSSKEIKTLILHTIEQLSLSEFHHVMFHQYSCYVFFLTD